MKPKRILIFSFAYYPRFVGGAEVAVKEVTDRIASNEIQFDMVTIGDGRGIAEEAVGNVKIYRVFKDKTFISKLLFPFAAFFKAQSLHRTRKYDAIWSIMANRAGFAALFFKWAHRNVPFILTLQEGDPLDYPRRRGWFVYPLFKYIFRKADRIQAISNFLAEWAKKMGARCPIEVIPNGIDYENFSKPIEPARRSKLRTDLGFSDNDVVIVTASRLVKKNAVDTIIESFVFLDASYKLLVLGSGDDETSLKAFAAKLKVTDRIVFKGFVSHADLPGYLQASDIFTRPSRSEGLGNSFLEAMAAGIPVIATPVGGIPDFLTDGETGLFCEVGHPGSLARKVEKFAKDHESRDYIVKQARKMVEERYQWKSIAERMKRVLSA